MPVITWALGLGQLELNSGLNQPFEARIELLSATADDLSSLNVRLADAEAFQRAGIDRLFILSSLRFELHETDTGPDFIRVYSIDPIREPYLNFLVEAAWAQGRLYREFTVLLDPPLYDPTVRRPTIVTPGIRDIEPDSARAPVSVPDESGPAVVGPQLAAGGYGLGEYGPTVASDTLWSIAANTRPDRSVSVQQMMVALLRANPEAFLDNNINGLKRGQVLRIPDRDEIEGLSQSEALAEARSQNAMWEGSRGVSVTPTRPISAAMPDTGATDDQALSEDSSELRLVSASQAGAGTDEGDSTGSAAGTGESGAALALANEQLEAITQENLELKDRLSEAESIIEDLRRLISLKDDELASLQLQAGTTEEPEAEAIIQGVIEDDLDLELDTEVITEEEITEAAMDEEAPEAETAVAEEAPVTTVVTEPEPISAPKGMVDQILDLVMGNIVYVAGAAGGLVVLIIGFIFVSRRKGKSAAVASAAFTDLEMEGEETEAPEAVAIDAEAETVLPMETAEAEEEEEEAPDADDATVFIAPGESAAEEAEVPEEDPLAEVNVFLAYEHFDQAEEFVRDAISSDPDNLDFHTKLLEIFYASGERSKYEAAAKVLQDKVDGQGPHWDMAVAMWSEISPNRALFEEGGVEETMQQPAAAGGVLDLTAEEDEKPAAGEMDLDFDLGDTTDVPAADADQGEDVLDVTAAVSISASDEDLLDVTAAVGLDQEPEPAAAGEDEMLLDITAGSDEPAEDLLDVSAQGGDSLLDVTVQADTGTLGGEEDLLDVTSATSAGADSDELLEISEAAPADEKDENLLDFDIGGVEEPTLEVPVDTGVGEETPSAGDNVIDFEPSAGGGDDEVVLDIGLADEAGDELSLDIDTGAENIEPDLGLSLDEEPIDSEAETMEVKLEDYQAGLQAEDSDKAVDDGLEIDLSIGDTDAEEPSLELTIDDQGEGGAELDLTIGEDTADSGLELDISSDSAAEPDIEATLKMPEIGLELETDADEDDDEDDHTVFVPRSADTQEQSEEDEIATKLDLAKAYVELGDKDSAKGILDEIIREGNDQQRKTAQDLLKQVS